MLYVFIALVAGFTFGGTPLVRGTTSGFMQIGGAVSGVLLGLALLTIPVLFWRRPIARRPALEDRPARDYHLGPARIPLPTQSCPLD